MTTRTQGHHHARIRNILSASAVAAAGMLATGICSSAALAADHADRPPQVKLTYSDLDLKTEAGSHALQQRILAAAARVCPWEYSHELRVIRATQECRATAIAAAMNDVHGQQLALARGTRPPEG